MLRGIVAPASLVPGASPAAADDDAATEIAAGGAVSADVLVALAGCHSLLPLDGKIVGDPLEKATLEGIEWWMPYAQDVVAPRHIAGGRNGANAAVERVRILHRHAFASSLRRMSSVVSVDFSCTRRPAAFVRWSKGRQRPCASCSSIGRSTTTRRSSITWRRAIAFSRLASANCRQTRHRRGEEVGPG